MTRILTLFVASLFAFSTARASSVCLPQNSMMFIGAFPQCPGVADSVTIYIDGGFPDLCWSPVTFDSMVTQGNLISVYASTVHSGSDLCFAQPIDYGFDVPVGRLLPDSYAVVVTVSIDTGKFAGTYLCDSSFYVAGMGDPNGDAVTNSGDIIHLVNHIFKSGAAPCGKTGDVTCDGVPSAADIIYLVAYVFKSGPPPPESCAYSGLPAW